MTNNAIAILLVTNMSRRTKGTSGYTQDYKVREVITSKVESAANTFTQETLTLTNQFSQAELDKGVVLLGADIVLEQLGSGSAANDQTSTYAQITKTSQTGLINIDDSALLCRKAYLAHCGAAVGLIHMDSLHRWPEVGGKDMELRVRPTRTYLIDKSAPYLYFGVKSHQQASAKTHRAVLYFAVKV
jgi:hypothetical protein